MIHDLQLLTIHEPGYGIEGIALLVRMAGHSGDIFGPELGNRLRDAHGPIGLFDPGDEGQGALLGRVPLLGQPSRFGQLTQFFPAGGAVFLQKIGQDDGVSQPVGDAVLASQGVGQPVDIAWVSLVVVWPM